MPEKKLNLALQGGGAHGAYTWGVLDRLLEEEDIDIEGISGTSAGAINAVVLASGFRSNGRKGARESLAKYGSRSAEVGAFANPIHQTGLEQLTEGWNVEDSFSYQWFDAMTRMFSPYQLNPYNLNPLRDILSEVHRLEKNQRRRRDRSCSSPRPRRAPGRRVFSATKKLTKTCCSPPPAFRFISRRSRSTASLIGTVAIAAIPASGR